MAEFQERYLLLTSTCTHSLSHRAMNEPPNRDVLLAELERERSIRRAAKFFHAKRSHVKQELNCLIGHLSLLVAVPSETREDSQPESDILIEAAKRIDDPVFSDLLIQAIQKRKY